MTRNPRLSWDQAALLLGAILCSAIPRTGIAQVSAPPAATAAPEAGGPVSATAPLEAGETLESILAPLLPLPEPTEPFVPTVPAATLTSPLPGDRGSMATIGGLGVPNAGPTAAERVKLEMARQAIQKALPYDISLAPACADQPLTLAPAEIEAAKLQRLLAMPPAVLPPDKAAGVGEQPPAQPAPDARKREGR